MVMIPKQVGHLQGLYQSGGKGAAAVLTGLRLPSPLSHSAALAPLLYVDVFLRVLDQLTIFRLFP